MSSSPYNQVTNCNTCGVYSTGCNDVQPVKIAAQTLSRASPVRPVRGCVPNPSCNKVAAVRAGDACTPTPTGLQLYNGLFANVGTYSPTNLAYAKYAVFGVIKPYRSQEGYYTALWSDSLVINDEGKTYITDTRESDYLKSQIIEYAERENGNVAFAFSDFAQVGSSSEIANIIGATLINYGINSILYLVDNETTTEIHLIFKAFNSLRTEFPSIKLGFAFAGEAPIGIVREDILKEMKSAGFMPDIFHVATSVSYDLRDNVKRILEGHNDAQVADPLARGAIAQLIDYFGFDCQTAMRMLGIWCDFNNVNESDFTSCYNYMSSMGYRAFLVGDIVTDSRSSPPNRKLEIFRSLIDIPFTSRVIG